jgi:ribokinase
MQNKRVIVAGSINMDIVTLVSKLPRPGETIIGRDLKYFPGGKGANQAVASAKLGAETVMIGKVGTDDFGKALTGFLEQNGIQLQVETADTPTGTALIAVDDSSENMIVVVPGANGMLGKYDVEAFPMSNGDILVAQFEIPLETIEAFFAKGKASRTVNILNPAPAKKCNDSLLELVDILILNETELEFFSGAHLNDLNNQEAIVAATRSIIKPNQQIIVTLGEKGAIIVTEYSLCEIAGHKVQAVDTTGAGDCFVGALSSQLAAGQNINEAATFANVAASISVQRYGASTSMPTLEEVISAENLII